MEWLIWLVVVAVFVVRGLLKAAHGSAGTDRARRAGRRADGWRQQQPHTPPPAGWQQPASPLADWFATTSPPPEPAPEPMALPPAEIVATPPPERTPTPDVPGRSSHPRETSQETAREPARERAQPVPSQLDAAAPAERYVGSAALESTLDSTIESSLFGVTGGSLTSSVLPGAAGPALPVELEAQVRAYLDTGHEVAAVRLVCDELEVGILDALRAVRSVNGLPSP